MKRREIVLEAKRLVAHHGPFQVQEFCDELIRNYTPRDDPRWEHKDEIVAEALIQADRVLTFLGV